MTPKQERLRKAYEFKIGKERTKKLSDEQILLLSKYYNSLSDNEQKVIDKALAQGRSNDLTDMADAFISEIDQEPYEPSDIIKQYDKQFDEAVAAYNKKVEDFKEKEDKRIAGMFQYEKPIGPQAMQGPKPMQGPKEPPVQGPKEAPKKKPQIDDPWESEVQDQLGTKIDEVLEQIRNEPLPQPTKTKRRKSKGKKKLSRKTYSAKELGVGESLNLILENVIETRESLFNLYKLEKERFEFKKKIDKKLTQSLAAKKRERALEKPKKPEKTFFQKKIDSAKKTIKEGLLQSLISGAILFSLPLIVEGVRGLLFPSKEEDEKPPGLFDPATKKKKDSPKPESKETEPGPRDTAEPVKPAGPTPPPLPEEKPKSPFEDVDPGSFTPYSEGPLGTFTWNTGGPVPGPKINKDIIPAMLTPGEFVMSKGAVDKFGLSTMMAMNKSGGGTNRPSYTGILPGYKGGGAVAYGEPAIAKAGMDAGFKDDELAAFLAQVAHESGNFRYVREIWGPTPDQRGYEGRRDLGNTQPGDGKRYMGRGYIQITGRANYRNYGRKIGMDLENNPELAEQPDVAAKIAVEYWKSAVRPMVGNDWSNVFKHSRAVNYPGATHPSQIRGMSDRRKKFDYYVKNLQNVKPKNIQPPPRPPSPGSEVEGYAGPPTPGTPSAREGLRSGNLMDLFTNPMKFGSDIIHNVDYLLNKKNQSMNVKPPAARTPVGANPRRNASVMPQLISMAQSPPPPVPDFTPPQQFSPVGRRSPQQPGS